MNFIIKWVRSIKDDNMLETILNEKIEDAQYRWDENKEVIQALEKEIRRRKLKKINKK